MTPVSQQDTPEPSTGRCEGPSAKEGPKLGRALHTYMHT